MHTFTSQSTSAPLQYAVLFLLAVSTSACQPQDVTPGLWLNGEVVEQIVSDWTFTDEIEEIFIETQTWYLLPHSTTIWCAEMSGELYIGSYADDQKFWESNVAQYPEARLRIDENLYEVSVTRVTNTQAIADLDTKYGDKYDMAEVFGENVPEWRYYRILQHN